MFSAASKTDNVSSAANYIEDVFSTYLYAGNGSTQTITNGIDLAGKGGLVWIKNKNNAGQHHALTDTARGINNPIYTDLTNAQNTGGGQVSAFNANGFSLNGAGDENYASGYTYASWTFRKQPKFFDVVTYTGNGTANNTIPHALGSTVGAIFIKNITNGSNWIVWHRSNSNEILCLNLTNANVGSYSGYVHDVTSTSFQVGTSGQPNPTTTNSSGDTYVAYLFAHDAGGFGTSGADNVISCGSFTTDGSGFATVTLGYEPQWVLVKKTSSTGAWAINDTMRGWVTGSALNTSDDATLFPNTTNADTTQGRGNPTATGFGYSDSASSDYIYIAIRRGPMKTPTSGTSVFSPGIYTGTITVANPNNRLSAGADLWINKNRTTADPFQWFPRLSGWQFLDSSATTAENTSFTWEQTNQTTLKPSADFTANSRSQVAYYMNRAPGFMDVVCYTGTGSNTTQTHNLGVVPELMIVKRRDTTGAWDTYSAALANTEYLVLNTTAAKATGATRWNSTTPTSSVFSLGTSTTVNASGGTYVAYLFASCPGVSKVGSYSGTGGTQTISCGFAARFVMIKRTDSTGDWWVWDTARGMVAGTDPRSAFNLASAETNANWVYTDASGFQIVTTDATVNASGGSYIFLAVA